MKYLIFLLALTSCASQIPNQRPYHMYLWDDQNGRDADASFIYEGYPQPQGRYLLAVDDWGVPRTTPYATTNNLAPYDLSKVDIFIIDEPFWANQMTTPNYPNLTILAQDQAYLREAVAYLHQISPNVPIWVNFSQPEIEWQMNLGIQLIDPSFDVLSNDLYFEDCPTAYYDWLFQNKYPNQKVAMILGTVFRDGVPGDEESQAQIMQQFFTYAHQHDIYALIGWTSLTQTPSQTSSPWTWRGELDPKSGDIHASWINELNKEIR